MTAEQHAAELTDRLADITTNLEAYIEQRAEEIAAAKVAVAENEFAGHLGDLGQELAELREGHAQAYRRWTDLEQELRRQLDVQLKQVAKLADALLDIAEYAEQNNPAGSSYIWKIGGMARGAVGYRPRSGSQRAEVGGSLSRGAEQQ